MTERPLEYCIDCDEPTGRAGASDDSIYTPEGIGPFCRDCFCEGAAIDKRAEQAAAAEQREREVRAEAANSYRQLDSAYQNACLLLRAFGPVVEAAVAIDYDALRGLLVDYESADGSVLDQVTNLFAAVYTLRIAKEQT